MSNRSRVLSSLAAGFLAIGLLAPNSAAMRGGGDFEACGVLVQGPVCIQFQADDGSFYWVEDLGPFGVGDRVRVIGGVFGASSGCLPFNCSGSYDGCILSNIIEPCDSATLFCFGDGGVTPGCTTCPCGNNAPADTLGGCINSSGSSGKLVASGEARIGMDTLRFEGQDLNPNTFAVLVSGDNALPTMGMCPPGAGIQTVNFDGLRCVGGNFKRHGTRAINSSGAVGQTTPGWGPPDGPGGGLSGQGGFLAGETRHFQIIYREDDLLVCLSGLNTSNAAEVFFIP